MSADPRIELHGAGPRGVRRAAAVGYETRAEVMYVSAGTGAGMDGIQRLRLKFLDAPLPQSLIPADAKPLSQEPRSSGTPAGEPVSGPNGRVG